MTLLSHLIVERETFQLTLTVIMVDFYNLLLVMLQWAVLQVSMFLNRVSFPMFSHFPRFSHCNYSKVEHYRKTFFEEIND